MTSKWKNVAILLVLAMIVAIGIGIDMGCVTQGGSIVRPQVIYESSPQLGESNNISFQLVGEYISPIYLGEGQKLHLWWSADGLVDSGYVLPDGAYFGHHYANDYWRRDGMGSSGIQNEFGAMDIVVGQTYEPLVEVTGGSSHIIAPGGIYEPGYYTIYFRPDYLPADVRYLKDIPDDLWQAYYSDLHLTTIHIQYRIE